MFDKSFVSIYFSRENLSILSLDSKKKKVTKKFSVSLPDNIIEGNKVKDVGALTEVLKGIWEKMHISEKTVGLIIPEYTTFIKVISTPTLQSSELDEAVRWSAQEFLPGSIKNLILDWKVVEKGEKDTKVLLAAIEKKLLSGYVDAAENAGLLPLGVETPSLSLSRCASENGKTGRLIVYGSGEEFLLIVAKGEAIYGTTVETSRSSVTLAKTALRMCRHYKDAGVSAITLAGVGISEEFLDSVRNELKLEVDWINPKISGLSEKEVQEFVAPICMQFSELEDPIDQDSLNLLPARLVNKYKKTRLRLQIWSLSLTVTLFVWISFLLTLGSYLFLNTQISEAKRKNAEKSSVAVQRQKAISDVKYVNDVVSNVLKIKNHSVAPQEVFNIINSAKPQGIDITKYKLTLEIGKIEFEGVSADRASLIELKNNLEENENIGDIEIPISSFEKETNLDFKVSFNYLPISKLVTTKK